MLFALFLVQSNRSVHTLIIAREVSSYHFSAKRLKGKKEKTASGKTKEDLMINKRGKVVHKRASAAGQERYKKNLMGWTEALMKARNELGIKGMCAVGGRTAQGKALYLKAKAIYSA